ncbi:hypothetical protein JW948_03020, partial [bacterium]|nr:hypothetical protein [bacterium]
MKLYKNCIWLLVLFIVLVSSGISLYGQAIGASGELKWLRINSLHSYFSEQGSEGETGGTEQNNNTFSWPGEYSVYHQWTMRALGMWMGCKDYYSSVLDRTFPYMVVNTGLKVNEYPKRPIFDAVTFELVGRFDHPIVVVDGQSASVNDYYDVLDRVDENLPADRMLVIRCHTAMGVTITKKVLVFTHPEHNNYYIYDYVLKNTGILDNDGTEYQQTINGLTFALLFRYSLAGESMYAGGNNWGASNSAWGRNTINDVIGTDPNAPGFEMRAHLAWYGPHSARAVSDDWGCPNQLDDGVMAAAKYTGGVTLHADRDVGNTEDDPRQPSTTHYVN